MVNIYCFINSRCRRSGLYSGTRPARFSPSAIMKEYEIISLKYNGKACSLYLLFLVYARI